MGHVLSRLAYDDFTPHTVFYPVIGAMLRTKVNVGSSLKLKFFYLLLMSLAEGEGKRRRRRSVGNSKKAGRKTPVL